MRTLNLSWIYVLDCPKGIQLEPRSCIKIGCSSQIKVRMQNLRYRHEVNLVGYVEGNYDCEQWIHRLLRSWRVPYKKEYYFPSPQVVSFAEKMLSSDFKWPPEALEKFIRVKKKGKHRPPPRHPKEDIALWCSMWLPRPPEESHDQK